VQALALMSGRNLGSRLGLSTLAGSNFANNKGSINIGVGLQSGAKISDYLV